MWGKEFSPNFIYCILSIWIPCSGQLNIYIKYWLKGIDQNIANEQGKVALKKWYKIFIEPCCIESDILVNATRFGLYIMECIYKYLNTDKYDKNSEHVGLYPICWSIEFI